MFYKLWNDAQHKRNDYVPIEVHWSEEEIEMKSGKMKQLETQVKHNLLPSLSVSL